MSGLITGLMIFFDLALRDLDTISKLPYNCNKVNIYKLYEIVL